MIGFINKLIIFPDITLLIEKCIAAKIKLI